MALKPKSMNNSNNSDIIFDVLEPDNYPARVVQVIDLGIQPQRPYKGEEKPPVHQIRMTYELVDAFATDKEGKELEDKPRFISEEFPLYPLESERAKSTLRYNAIDPKKTKEGDFSGLVGAPCVVLVGQYRDAKGEMRNGVNGVSPVMRGQTLPEIVNPPAVFLLDDPDLEVFKAFPEWLQTKIKGNGEYKGSALEAALAGGSPAPKEEPKPKKEPEPAPADEVNADENKDDDTPW